MRTIFLSLGLFLITASALLAQETERPDTDDYPYPLKGKTVAVYFSKKQFTFDDNYRIPLSQFIRSDQGSKAEIEDLKLQTLISLGTLFSAQLGKASGADSVYFLNEFPEKARAFIKNYSSETHQLEAIPSDFPKTDFILVVNPLMLGSYKTSAVFTRSNRIVTEQVVVKTARMRMELYDPRRGLLQHIHKACMDERKTSVPERLFEFHMQHSRTGDFLGKLFSLAVLHMNQGVDGNCDPQGE